MQAEAEEEAEGQVDMRAMEHEAIESLAKARGCRVVDVSPGTLCEDGSGGCTGCSNRHTLILSPLCRLFRMGIVCTMPLLINWIRY